MESFQNRFYDKEKDSYGDAGGNVLALRMGVPDDQYEKVVTALKAGLKATKGHLDTGIIGTRFFFEVLAENGLQELAYEALNKRTEPGYKHIIFRSQPVDQLEHATYLNKTPNGEGGITWRNKEESFEMDIVVPVSSSATVYVPAKDQKYILENGQRYDLAVGVEFLRMEDDYAVIKVESGTYSFRVLK